MSAESWLKRTAGRVKRLYGIPASGGKPDERHEAMTLGQLVTLVSDDPLPANRDAFYGRLLFSKVGIRVANPDDSLAPGRRVTTKDEEVDFPSATDPDGNVHMVVYCDIPALWAAFPDDAFEEYDARVVLEMARSNGLGLVVQNVLGEQQASAAVSKDDVGDVLSGRYSKTVVLPAGHRVVVIEPTPAPYFAQCESGVWIAELGGGEPLDEIMAQMREALGGGFQRMAVIWILQPIVLERPGGFDAVVAALHSILSRSRNFISHSAVVPYATERHLPMMRRLKEIGMEVHYSGPHGECFIEVHKPDGIVVAWPGRAFSG